MGSEIGYPNPKRLKTLASNVKYSEGNTLLHQFVLSNSEQSSSCSGNYINAVLRSMSDLPYDIVNVLNDKGYTALHLAALKNNPVMVKKLLSCLMHVNVNAMNCVKNSDNKSTALHLAAKLGHLSVARELLCKGACIDAKNEQGLTALCLSANHLDLMELLVSEGANVNLLCGQSDMCTTALCQAAKSGNMEAVNFLISSGAEVNTRCLEKPICCAVRSGSLALVKFLVSNGADVNAEDGIFAETPLHEAVYLGRLDIVEYLVSNQADKGAMNVFCHTPLYAAIYKRHLDIVAFLIDQEAHCAALFGKTSLHEAVTLRGNLDILELLINKGADLEARDSDGSTPLHHAIYHGNMEGLQLLMSKGANMGATDDKGKTALHYAACGNSLECASYLLDQGADIMEVDKNGWTALHFAAHRGSLEMLRFFLDRGVDRFVEDVDGNTPLDIAREARRQSYVDALQNTRQR